MPRARASLDRDTTQPSLLLSTTTGFPSRSGRNSRSQLTKKLLQSIRANILGILVNDSCHHAPYIIISGKLIPTAKRGTGWPPGDNQIRGPCLQQPVNNGRVAVIDALVAPLVAGYPE